LGVAEDFLQNSPITGLVVKIQTRDEMPGDIECREIGISTHKTMQQSKDDCPSDSFAGVREPVEKRVVIATSKCVCFNGPSRFCFSDFSSSETAAGA
jgi:hypothetical protein